MAAAVKLSWKRSKKLVRLMESAGAAERFSEPKSERTAASARGGGLVQAIVVVRGLLYWKVVGGAAARGPGWAYCRTGEPAD